MATRKSGTADAPTPRKRAASPRSNRTDLGNDLRDFAAGRPQGWNHEDWETFLGFLSERGHDTSNADAIGLALERERLALALSQVEGVGPRRMEALVDRFVTIWSLRNADVEEIAATARIRRDLAERIKTAVAK
jgi:hypothetical protein